MKLHELRVTPIGEYPYVIFGRLARHVGVAWSGTGYSYIFATVINEHDKEPEEISCYGEYDTETKVAIREAPRYWYIIPTPSNEGFGISPTDAGARPAIGRFKCADGRIEWEPVETYAKYDAQYVPVDTPLERKLKSDFFKKVDGDNGGIDDLR